MTKAQQKRRSALADLGCALCHLIHGPHDPGPVELHHLRSGGWGKGGDETLIPLCHDHHRGRNGIHTLGTKAWERDFFTTQAELLAWTLKLVPA